MWPFSCEPWFFLKPKPEGTYVPYSKSWPISACNQFEFSQSPHLSGQCGKWLKTFLYMSYNMAKYGKGLYSKNGA